MGIATVRDRLGAGASWVEATIREAERTQAAAHQIQRYAAHELGEAAGVLAATAFEMVGSVDPLAQMGKLNAAIDAFYDAGLRGGLRKSFTLRRPRPPEAAQEAGAG